MASPDPPFHEAHVPIRDLGLAIAGTRLEPIVRRAEEELARAGFVKLRPRFYLSTEWGVPSGTVAVALPFYLADARLTALHSDRAGHVEGEDASDILRYLRHEIGHAVNYAYRLYEEPEWVRLFGAITQPYEEEYRPAPFSRRFVRHLPGWYAQKHPDEDWAETFAVWLTPGLDWRAEYRAWPVALAKLEHVDRTARAVGPREPLVSRTDLDEDVGELGYSLDDYYRGQAHGTPEALAPDPDLPPGLDGALRAIFHDATDATDGTGALGEAAATPPAASRERRAASALLHAVERALMADVYRWTGHFPERTRPLVRHLAARADELRLTYAANDEVRALVAVTTLVTALAMNHVHRGTYSSA